MYVCVLVQKQHFNKKILLYDESMELELAVYMMYLQCLVHIAKKTVIAMITCQHYPQISSQEPLKFCK